MIIKKYLIICCFTFLFLILFFSHTGILHAGAPVGMGPGATGSGLIDTFDWWNTTASGCIPSVTFPAHICTGHTVQGDTYYFTGLLADGSIIGTVNDYSTPNCLGSCNFGVLKLAAFSWATPSATRIDEVNSMSSFNTGADYFAWRGKCGSTDTTGNCTGGWHSRTLLALDGKLYIPVERQYGYPRDATLIESADGGATWKNPYTVHHSGSASAGGDMPKCGATTNATDPCSDASYPDSIMWPMTTSDGPFFYQFGRDGALPTNVGGDCDPTTWVCVMFSDEAGGGGVGAYVGRVSRANLPNLNSSDWTYVSALDANYQATWSSSFSARVPVLRLSSSSNDVRRPLGVWSAPTYIKEFNSYLLLGADYGGPPGHHMYMFSSPGPFGPWTLIGVKTSPVVQWIGFATPNLGMEYTVVSTNPPHIQVTIVTENKDAVTAGSPYFTKWDLVLGRQVAGDAAVYTDTGLARLNSGWQFTAGDVPGTFNRKGLVWAFDFMDHGGVVGSYPFFHDVANSSAVMIPCFTDGGEWCGNISSGKGAGEISTGIQLSAGYAGRYESNISDMNFGSTGGNQNAPSAMQGNGSYTVATIFRYDSGQFDDYTGIWQTGNSSSDNTQVGLSYKANTADHLTLSWIGRSFTAPSFTMTAGDWYFITTTVQANGSTPTAHIWAGASGALTDIIAGVSRAGSGTATPNVAAGPLILMPSRGEVSYAGLMVYNRALSNAEVQSLYQSFKSKMAERGVTVQ